MRDVLAPETGRIRALIDVFRTTFERVGYREIRTPLIEELDVFLRVGEGTDVVGKEMYVFEDRDGTTVALRPETTASVVRAFLEHHPLTPWKVWYVSEHFRHEKPQKGRLRQHTQLGSSRSARPTPTATSRSSSDSGMR
jgi:histidyl-tRNA synthetase